MPELRGTPPGRAGLLWLRNRLQTARRAADLLDRKLFILRGEQDRLRQLTASTDEEWTRACREADGWLLRGAMLAGEDAVRMAASTRVAQITIRWESLMGVRYPAQATCSLPEAYDDDEPSPTTAALVEAAAAYRSAVLAAAAHAAATAAYRAMDNEITQTRRRLRAITTVRIPDLATALTQLDARLEESERAELIRMRWAIGGHETT